MALLTVLFVSGEDCTVIFTSFSTFFAFVSSSTVVSSVSVEVSSVVSSVEVSIVVDSSAEFLSCFLPQPVVKHKAVASAITNNFLIILLLL